MYVSHVQVSEIVACLIYVMRLASVASLQSAVSRPGGRGAGGACSTLQSPGVKARYFTSIIQQPVITPK